MAIDTSRLFEALLARFGVTAIYRPPGAADGWEVCGILQAGVSDPDLGGVRTRLIERRFVVPETAAAALAKGGTLTLGTETYTLAADPLHRALTERELLLRPVP